MPDVYTKVENINNWKKLNDFYYDNTINNGKWENWIFRGQLDFCWDLKTSLERSFLDYVIDLKNADKYEKGMLRRFKRQFHLFTNDIPDDNDYVRWFSIMQHYGCPTRMLDFTYSFFIALFFATEKVSLDTSSHVDCAIWSINHKWLKDKFHKHGKFRLIYLKDKNLKQVGSIKAILNSKSAFIKSLNPLCLNQRLVLQQGLFLLPLDIRKPFMDNLGNIAKEKETRKNVLKIKISIDKKFLNEIYYNLNRMNINNATLFPDIDGFARYLKMVLPIHDKYGGFLAIDKNKF